MQASRARLFKEYKDIPREKSADPDIQLVCDDSNIFKWTTLIQCPSETPHDGGVFQLAFAVPEQYPLQPPQVRFLTKIYHPNVHFKGRPSTYRNNGVDYQFYGVLAVSILNVCTYAGKNISVDNVVYLLAAFVIPQEGLGHINNVFVLLSHMMARYLTDLVF